MDPEQALIVSDAETGEFREGTVLFLADPDACHPDRWECPSGFREKFNRAREAIENGKLLAELKAAVQSMQQESRVPREHYLDVCVKVPGVDKDEPGDRHPMTLLAFAGYHARKDMLDFLIAEGAHVDMGNPDSATPLIQMLAYFIIQNKPQQLDISIVQYFIDKGAALSRVCSTGMCHNATALDISLGLCRLDVVKLLVKSGVDPIRGGEPDMRPIFIEYVNFGSHEYMKWLLGDHLKSEIPAFVQRLLHLQVFSNDATEWSASSKGRNVAHAFLLSGNKEVTHCLLDRKPDLMKECDPFKKTALHLAAEKGDCESVRHLLDRNFDMQAKDEDSMTPLMLATRNGHIEVVKLFFHKLLLISKESTENGTRTRADLMGLMSWALQYEFPAFFEDMHETQELEEILMSPLDNDGNTVAHLAAEGGHVSVFKSTFPKIRPVPGYEILMKKNKQDKTPLQLAIEKGNIGILNALQERRAQREKQASKKDLDKQQIESMELKEWQKFWKSQSPKLLLYSCLHGTVEIVKYFVSKVVPPTTRIDRYTPLACAAKAGNYDIMAYLLSIKDVTPEGVAKDEESQTNVDTDQESKKPHSPLMLASRHGHDKCVTLLLKKEADIGVKSERGYNCLMEAIKAGHEEVAIAILRCDCWKKMMKLCVTENSTGKTEATKIVTPMRMLIETMPEVASMVFTNCLSDESKKVAVQPGHPEQGEVDVNVVQYDYEFIEDYCEEPQHRCASGNTSGSPIQMTSPAAKKKQESNQGNQSGGNASGNDDLKWLIDDEDGDSSNGTREEGGNNSSGWGPKGFFALQHPLSLMVNHSRLKLLQHPLISRYITYKWWKGPFAFFLLYMAIYIIFVILLTSFAVSVPRPGPDDQYCPSNNSGPTYVELNFKDGDCKDPSNLQKGSFATLAVILILLSIAFLVFELWVRIVMRERQKYFIDYETVIRIGLFLLTIVFVFGFVNDCWCAPPWQWQIGALVVFFAYINILLLLKGMPVLGVPINMLLHIVFTFFRLIYLPILLILAFAFPFYMIFVRDAAAVLDTDGPGILEAFSTPAHSIAKVFVQTAGELDFGAIFNDGDLLYSPMAYILFISFVVLMPILFSNLLIGLAVGTADEDQKLATFTNIKLQVDFMVGIENSKSLRRLGEVRKLEFREKPNANPIVSMLDKWRGVDYQTHKRLVEDAYVDTYDTDDSHKEATQVLKEKVTKMAVKMDDMQERFAGLERNQKQLQESLEANIQLLQRSIEELLKK